MRSVDLCAVERGHRRRDRATNRCDDRIASLLTTAAAIDVWVVMRREGKGMG